MLHKLENSGDIKRNRPSLSQKSYIPELLKSLVFGETVLSASDRENCVKQYLCQNIVDYELKGTVFEVHDNSFKAYLLNEASLQFVKSIYNLSIYKQLVSKGVWSWSCVTLYYSQFYAICGLLNLQGNAFSRPLLMKEGSEKQALFHIYPKDFIKGEFYFERRDYSPHEDLWKQYHKTYWDYRYNLEKYSSLYEYDRLNQCKFMHLRHEVNYDISFLTRGFIEYLFSREELEEFAIRMQQDSLSADISEDEYLEIEYISVLRINLLFDILHSILDNFQLRMLRAELYDSQLDMLSKLSDETCISRNFSSWICA
jgi:hypothetical protein